MSLTFNAADHTYRDERERQWPSVTKILGAVPPWYDAYRGVRPDVLEYKRQLGSAVHHATALDDLGTLDESSVQDVIGIRLEGWRRYRRESGFEALDGCIELIVAHPTMDYAGTLDRLGRLRNGDYLLPDVKTADPSSGLKAGPQTAAYLEAYRTMAPNNLPARVARGSVHLTDDGQYHFVPHTSRRDFKVFCAALELWNFSPERRTRHA